MASDTAAPSGRPIVIAHRGASGYRPEHTRPAFELAITLGADAVEPDLVVSRDGVLVVRHENEISGTTDVASRREFASRRTTKTVDGVEITGWFTEDLDWAELATLRTRERLPRIRPANTEWDGAEPMLRLEDLLTLLDGTGAEGVRLVAELKHAAYFASIGSPLEPLLLGVLDRAGWGDDARLTVESFELTALQRLRRDGLEAPLFYLLDASGAPADRPSSPYSAAMTDAGLDALGGQVQGISVDKKVLLGAPDAGALVARAHERGLLVYSWTLRPENRFLTARHRSVGRAGSIGHWRAEFSEIFDSGVDGVFADHPDLAIEVRDGAREPSA